MATILREKFTANVKEPFVFFIVGGHINNVLRPDKWLPIVWQFVKLIRYVQTHPETGCLGGNTYLRIFPFGMIFQAYWRSYDDLEHWARSKSEGHLGAWQDYLNRIGWGGQLAIYHELYVVEPGKFEAVYGNSAPYGLSKAMGAVSITGRAHNARGRINPNDESVSEAPLIPLPPNP
ncbi:MAG: DUF4188 domain-containing protein [Chloroflexota bacterium]